MPLIYSLDSGKTWEFSKQDTTVVGAGANTTINGIACAESGTRWAAVGNEVYFSDDGMTWTKITEPSNPIRLDSNRYDVKYNSGTYVCASAYYIFRSSDAFNWEIVHNHGGAMLLDGKLAFGNNTWVMAGIHSGGGGAEAVHHSTNNGQTWSRQTSPPGFNGYCRGINFGKGNFVVVGGNGSAIAARSTDGQNWTTINGPWADKQTLTVVSFNPYSQDWWVIANPSGDLYRSVDSVTWEKQPPSSVDLSRSLCLMPIP
jgi:photosystem II stability/assembly factor-like uncharacterized protein